MLLFPIEPEISTPEKSAFHAERFGTLITRTIVRVMIQTFRENIEIFIKTNKEIILEVNSEMTLYMITFQNIVQDQNIANGNLWIQNMEKFEYRE